LLSMLRARDFHSVLSCCCCGSQHDDAGLVSSLLFALYDGLR
jgi:hypothetical protein